MTKGPPAGRFQRAGFLVEQRLDLFHGIDIDHGHVGAHQMVEQQVALERRPLDAVDQDQRDREAALPRRRGDLPAPVGLGVGARDHGIGARVQDLGEGELQMARLVAAEGQSSEVVPLDVEGAHADRLGEPGAGVERRRQMRKPDARLCRDAGSEFGPRHRCLRTRFCYRHGDSPPVRQTCGHPIAGGKHRATKGDTKGDHQCRSARPRRAVQGRRWCTSIPQRYTRRRWRGRLR